MQGRQVDSPLPVCCHLQQSVVLQADVAADQIVFENLRACGEVAVASSEESTQMQDLGGNTFSVNNAHRLAKLKLG